MTGTFSPARRPAQRVITLVGGILLVATACGGGAPVAPTAGPTLAADPSATIAPVVSLAPPATTLPSDAPTLAPPPTTPVTEPPPTEAPPVVPGIGVPIQIGDQQFMTVVAAEQWPGATGVKPAKGKAFYTVSVQIDAIALTSFDSADFNLRAGDKTYSWRPGRAPHLYSLDNMTAGATYTGWINYELPKAALGDLVLVYKPAFLPGSTYRVPLT